MNHRDIKEEDLAERVRNIDSLRTAKVNGIYQLYESEISKKFMHEDTKLIHEPHVE